MTDLIAEYLGVALAASVKFMPTPFLALNGLGYTFLETIIVTSIGGIAGVTVFYLFADFLMSRAQRKRQQREKRLRAEGKYKPKRKFTWMNKLIIRAKWRLGIVGLAILTPAILSIPIGSVVSAKFYSHNKYMLLYLIISVIFSSLTLTTLAYVLDKV